jgi:hypothetical protein
LRHPRVEHADFRFGRVFRGHGLNPSSTVDQDRRIEATTAESLGITRHGP